MPRERPQKSKDGNNTKAKARYVIYEADGSNLTYVAEAEGRNPQDAVKAHLGEGEQSGEHSFTVVPRRNISTVKVSVKSVPKVSFS